MTADLNLELASEEKVTTTTTQPTQRSIHISSAITRGFTSAQHSELLPHFVTSS